MTENKRFVLSDRHLSEIGNDNVIYEGIIPCTQREVCKLLNELNDENKQLKTFFDKYNKILKQETGLNIIETLDKITKLNDENIKLKQKLVRRKVVYNYFHDKYHGLLRLIHGFDKK